VNNRLEETTSLSAALYSCYPWFSGGGDALLYGVGVERSTTHRRLRQNSAKLGNTRQQVRWQVSTVDCWRT